MSTHARFALRLLALLVLPALAWGQSPGILINEFLASNQTTNKDPDFGESSDWIELYNPAREPTDLSGYYMTDDLDEPRKWQIPRETWIPGAGFLLLWADGRNTGLHTSFKLSKEGEQLGLYTPAGVPVDTLSFGA